MNGKVLAAIAASVMVASCAARKAAAPAATSDERRVLIIFYDAEVGKDPLLAAAKSYGSETVYLYSTLNGAALTIPDGKTVAEAISYYRSVRGVLTVNEDRKVVLHGGAE